MFQASQNRRLCFITMALVSTFFGLWYQMYRMQILHYRDACEKVNKLMHRVRIVDAPRGDIRDRRGSLLAGSEPLVNIYANTTLTRYCPRRISKILARHLETEPETVCMRMAPLFRGFDEHGEWIREHQVELFKNVPLEKWNPIVDELERFNFGMELNGASKRVIRLVNTLRKKAIYAVETEGRTYPNGMSFAHGLGFASYANGIRRVGLRGIECSMESFLSGKQGFIDTLVDFQGSELPAYRRQYVQPIQGNNVYLTIDLTLQTICDEALAKAMDCYQATNAFAIMIQPFTGEILALSSQPAYYPEDIGDCPSLWRNPVVESLYEPGSTFKVLTIAAALEMGIIRMDEEIFCENGIFRFEKCRPLHDVHPYGNLTVAEILAKSSNIGTAKIALRLGADQLYAFIDKFGFGKPAGILLPSEVSGRIKSLGKLTMEDKTRIPIGYSILVSPLQMTLMYCALANGGWLIRPLIIHHIEDRQGRTCFAQYPEKISQVLSEGTARKMSEALQLVISPQGTARLAALSHYTTSGKTGTSRKTVTINGKTTYDSNVCLSSFIGFLSSNCPEICIGIFLDGTAKNLSGGKTSAVVFKEIAERTAAYLRLKPDKSRPIHLVKN